ncbi:MAG: holo-ACP synthase [Alphaproteobacteria bacterium]|nr:holo-ACP synthase [Alphaproteobacteria bacterium]
MIIGVGTDLVDCRRLEKAMNRNGQRFLDRVFTGPEQKRCNERLQKIQSFGKIYAAKEATLKAIGNVAGIHWKEIEINHLPNGKPIVNLAGQALVNFNELLGENELGKIDISLTDEPPYAQAFVIITATSKERTKE